MSQSGSVQIIGSQPLTLPKDYEGIVKCVQQIPLRQFNYDPQSSAERPAAATTQSKLPNARNSSNKTSSSSLASSSKPESNMTHHVAAVV